MKNTNTLAILLLVFSALLLAYFFLPGETYVAPPPQVHGHIVSDFLPEKVTAVNIKRGDVVIELKKVDKDWVLPKQKDRKALAGKVDSLLGSIRDASITQARVSTKLSDFDLSPETRTEITLQRESGVTKVTLGKSIAYNASFALNDKNEILEIDKNPARDAGVTEKDGKSQLDTAWFYDLKILGDEPKDAIDVSIKKGHEVTRLQKVIPGKGPLEGKQSVIPPEAIWWITEPDGVAADDSKVSSLLSTLLNLNATAYADDVAEKDRGFDKPTARVLIRLKDGIERNITFGNVMGDIKGTDPKDKDAILLSVSGRPDVFKVQKYVFDTATKTSDLIKKEEPPATAPSTTAPPTPPAVSPHPTVIPPPPPKMIKPNIPPAVPALKPIEVPAPKVPEAPKTTTTTTPATTASPATPEKK